MSLEIATLISALLQPEPGAQADHPEPFVLPLGGSTEVASAGAAAFPPSMPRSRNMYLPGTGTLLPRSGDPTSPEATSARRDAIRNAIENAGPGGSVIVDVLTRGKGLIGGGGGSLDVLRDTLQVMQETGRTDVGVEAWFEGVAAHPSTPYGRLIESSGASLGKDPSGSHVPDLTQPAVSSALRGMVEQVASNTAVTAIEFDDHYGIPPEFMPALLARHPEAPKGGEAAWLRNELTKQFAGISGAAKAAGKDVILSMNSTFEIAEATGQDPVRWVKEGLVDTLEAQIYRPDARSFDATLGQVESRMRAELARDPNAFKNLDEFRVAVGPVANGVTLSPEVREAQIQSANAFAARMQKEFGIRVEVSVWDANTYMSTGGTAPGTDRQQPLI